MPLAVVSDVHRRSCSVGLLKPGGSLAGSALPSVFLRCNANSCTAQTSGLVTASQNIVSSAPQESSLLQHSVPHHPETPPENTKVSARTARRRARKKEAAQIVASPVNENHLIHAEEWAGLASWRAKEVDESRGLGKAGPEAGVQLLIEPQLTEGFELADTLAGCGRQVLETADPLLKSLITHKAFCAYKGGKLPVGEAAAPDAPARPDKPVLVSPREVPPPKRASLPLNAYMLHTLAHIELNAIDLAWDTLVRFSPLREQLGERFFADFAQVADDESRHLGWVLQRLAELGHGYGDMPAHDLLWRDALKTSGDVTARLAVVPMVQEARGLDAGPRLVDRLIEMGDARSATIVQKIAEEELAHVAVGVTWFLDVCRRSGTDPGESFQGLIQTHCQDTPKGPFNHTARAAAGVPRHWYDTSAPPPRNEDSSSALESKAKLEAKRRGATLGEGKNKIRLEMGTMERPESGGRADVSSGFVEKECVEGAIALSGGLLREGSGGPELRERSLETGDAVGHSESGLAGRTGESGRGKGQETGETGDASAGSSAGRSSPDGATGGVSGSCHVHQSQRESQHGALEGESTIGTGETRDSEHVLIPQGEETDCAPLSGDSRDRDSNVSLNVAYFAEGGLRLLREGRLEGGVGGKGDRGGKTAMGVSEMRDENGSPADFAQVRERLACLVAMEHERASV